MATPAQITAEILRLRRTFRGLVVLRGTANTTTELLVKDSRVKARKNAGVVSLQPGPQTLNPGRSTRGPGRYMNTVRDDTVATLYP